MNFGFITTPLAYLNYRKKKEAYDAAIRKYEDLKEYAERVVEEYQEMLLSIQNAKIHVNENGDYAQYDDAPGLEAKIVLQVGNLVGKKMNIRAQVRICNNSEDGTSYIIQAPVGVRANFRILGVRLPWIAGVLNSGDGKDFVGTYWRDLSEEGRGVAAYKAAIVQSSDINKTAWCIEPGGYIQIQTDGSAMGLSLLSKDQMKLLRNMICHFAGKKLITSVKKGTTINGKRTYEGLTVLESDIEAYRVFRNEGSTVWRDAKWMVQNTPVVLEYMGEAFYPNSSLLWSEVLNTI